MGRGHRNRGETVTKHMSWLVRMDYKENMNVLD